MATHIAFALACQASERFQNTVLFLRTSFAIFSTGEMTIDGLAEFHLLGHPCGENLVTVWCKLRHRDGAVSLPIDPRRPVRAV